MTQVLLQGSLAMTPDALVSEMSVRRDSWVQLVVIAVALVIAVGLAVAWWITCQ